MNASEFEEQGYSIPVLFRVATIWPLFSRVLSRAIGGVVLAPVIEDLNVSEIALWNKMTSIFVFFEFQNFTTDRCHVPTICSYRLADIFQSD